MKMRKSEHFIRSSSSIQGQAFNVKMNDKMFETLFSSLYRYKEAAALRETTCNAIDSHGMRDRMHRMVASHYAPLTPPPARHGKYLAPKGTRVVVHLPDDFEPWLEIRDYGIGLPLEKIIGEAIPAQEDEVLLEGNMVVKEDEIPDSAEVIGVPGFYNGSLVFRREDGEIIRSPGLYTTLFHSTKEEDDDQIGAFGLGSKSPFAVSDSFTVESRMDGKLHRFLMYLNAKRIPTVDLITKDLETRDPKPEDTDEFNGMTVKIPVKNARFSAFSDELVRLGRVMRPEQRPVVENASYRFGWEDISYDFKVNNTYIQPKGNDHTHYAVMGGVSYPIDLDQLDPDTSSIMSKFPSSYTFFELGSLNVPPSREDLSYDEFTRETLSEEFKETANAILTDKMRDLEMACKRGPLALYMEKAKLSEMFGSGFRKMVEKEYPADKRFHDSYYRYPLPVEIDRDYDHTAPFNELSSPFSMEIFYDWGESSTLTISEIQKWIDRGQHVTVVVEDSVRARNLKIKQLKDTGTMVIVAKPNTSYVTKRNQSKDNPAFRNAQELHDFFKSWIGEEETTIDYLFFADKFMDWLGAVLEPAEVKFMNELTYVTPPVTKDPGLFPFTRSDFDIRQYEELTGEQISDIINKGERIVYIEVSGHECIHQVMDRTLTTAAARGIREALYKHAVHADEDGKPVYIKDMLNIHDRIFLARRKSVPMMKKFPEVFIPIDEILKIMLENVKPMMERDSARRILESYRRMRLGADRLKYGIHLVEQAFGVVEDDRYGKLVKRYNKLMRVVDDILDEQTVRHYQSMAKVPVSIHDKRRFSHFQDTISSLNVNLYSNERDEKIFRSEHQMLQIFGYASDALQTHGFTRFDIARTPTLKARRDNRLTIERHRVIRFLKENYKPSALNPIENSSDYLDVISNSIVRA
ncbi:RIIA protein [Enterobacter phage EspM4VN]|uniref:RIIA protein n=1 Tax=Enterobacter phage EspM4VN TaxID=2137745 RepID=A0A2Z6C8C1_9CAUD|nr:RIIA lysis inhibitor [Enterobacter phage EspM4VN]BBD52225.1 RIIA protein [Enterobacter phage EspM4VN]